MFKARHIVTFAATALALAGCKSGYDIDIRNLTDQPVVASLASTHPNGGDVLLANARLGPGDRGALFKETDSKERVWLEVDFAGNTGFPAKMDLSRGRTVVNVRRADQGSKGHVALEEVAHP